MFGISPCHTPLRVFLVLAALLGLVFILPAKTAHASTYTVINTNDSGAGSLRQAILAANANSGLDTITFNIPGAGPHTITLTDDLPEITSPVVVDGLTQPGANCASWPPTLKITITGLLKQAFAISAGNSTIRGLAFMGLYKPIELRSAGGNSVQCNLIGTDVTGSAGERNIIGISIVNSPNNLVGGTAPSSRNLISNSLLRDPDANTLTNLTEPAAIKIVGNDADGNTIAGNYIGTDLSGTSLITNTRGIWIENAPNNVIGGLVTGAGNVIGGNSFTGVAIMESGATGNTVQGNFLNTNPSGTAALPLASSFYPQYIDLIPYPVLIFKAANNTVGGTTSAARNLIVGAFPTLIAGSTASNNTIQGNFLDIDITGTTKLGDGGAAIANAPNNLIGGTTSGAGNLIASEVSISGSDANNNKVQGNYIGIDLTGTRTFTDTFASLSIREASNNTIGGTSAAARNIIGQGGVRISSSSQENATANNVVQGNYIGTNATGMAKLINYSGSGITIEKADDNTIGGTEPGSGNLIAGYTEYGVLISDNDSSGNRIQGNLIGTDVSGTADLTDGSTGVRIRGAASTIVGGTTPQARNIISGNSNAGVLISGDSSGESIDNIIQGNYIGTNAAGSAPIPNGFAGVFIFNATKTTIGGSATGAGNLISGNGYGVRLSNSARENSVQGNLIGTTSTGRSPLGNQRSGVSVTAPNNVIGGTTAGARNIIAGNNSSGVELTGSGATGNTVQGNYIGTAINGVDALGNAAHGILITDVANKNIIGGITPQVANTIAYNGGTGISISRGVNNTLRGNRIMQNGGLGIDLGEAGPTANDTGDLDQGANQLMNAPALLQNVTNLAPGVSGTFNGSADATITIDLYANGACDSSGFGEGERWIGSKTVTTDSNGNALFSFELPNDLAEPGVAATATDQDGNTSEFSPCLALFKRVYLPLLRQ